MEDQPNFSLAFDLPAIIQANKSNENEAQQALFPNLSDQELEKIVAEGTQQQLRRPQVGLWQLLEVNISVVPFFVVFFFVSFVKPTKKPVNYKINKTIGDKNIFGLLSFQKTLQLH